MGYDVSRNISSLEGKFFVKNQSFIPSCNLMFVRNIIEIEEELVNPLRKRGLMTSY